MALRYKAYPTLYHSTQFRSRLEAQWACFFDIVKIEWQYEPFDLENWVPDFLLTFTCPYLRPGSVRYGTKLGDKQCHAHHKCLAEIKPASTYEELLSMKPKGMPNPIICYDDDELLPIMLGINPDVSVISTGYSNGNGYGGCELESMCGMPGYGNNWRELWAQAGNVVRWCGSR